MPADIRIFRKVALDRLSSPDQIDKLLNVTSSRAWLALVAAKERAKVARAEAPVPMLRSTMTRI